MTAQELEAKEGEIQKEIEELAGKKNLITDSVEPIYDGIYSAEKYLSAPLRLMWVLKEPYDDSDENCGSKVTEIQESFVNSKLDCSRFEDDGRRFIPSNLDNATIKYQNGEDYIEPNNQMLVDKNLPPVDTIPND